MKVVIIDYDCGNLFSVLQALEKLSVYAQVSSDLKIVLSADRVILPGVGAFQTGMKKLTERGLVDTLVECARKGTPILGICLGMQLLLEKSFEFGQHKGLGLIPGTVELLRTAQSVKLPHVGWDALTMNEANHELWRKSIFRDFQSGHDVYFSHSYVVHPKLENHMLGWSQYGGTKFCTALMANSIFGCQFHPEKSGHGGLKMIENFLFL